MIFIPSAKVFRPEEIFPPWICDRERDDNGRIRERIWRLMDGRILWTVVQMRDRYDSSVTVNDYLWGGGNDERGYRDPTRLIDLEHFKKTGEIIADWSSFYSQHCLGNALDCIFKKISAEEIRQDIIANSELEVFKYITGIEKGVSWLHIDSRNHTGRSRFIIF